MKNQRMKTNQSFRISAIMVTLLMIVMLMGCFAVTSFAAASVTVDTETDIEIGLDLVGGIYTKEYDGTTAADVTSKAANVTVQSAAFNSANVGDANELIITLTKDGVQTEIRLPARIAPKTLYWDGNAAANGQYKVDGTVYELAVGSIPTLKDADGNPVTGIAVDDTAPYKVTVQANAAGNYNATASVTLKATSNDVPATNYVAAPLPVDVTITPITVTTVDWANDYTFEYGDAAANGITVVGYDADNNEYRLVIVYPTGYGAVGSHSITAGSADPSIIVADDSAKTVVISPKTLKVTLGNTAVIGNEGLATNPRVFLAAVQGIDGVLPTEVLDAIRYTDASGAAFTGVYKYGVYTVNADLSAVSGNYRLVDANGNAVTALQGTISVNRPYIAAGVDGKYQLVITGPDGVAPNATASVTVPEKLNRKAIRGFRYFTAYDLKVENFTDAYTVLIPIEDVLLNKNCDALTVNDLYVYDAATGTMIKASESTGLAVTLNEGYFEVTGATVAGYTFVVAPEYNLPFAISAPGIALWIFLLLAILVGMFFFGMYLRRVKAGENEVIVIDTDGEVPAVEATEPADTVDADGCLEDNLDAMAEALDAELAAEEAETEADAEAVDAAVAEAMDQIIDEASQIDLDAETDADAVTEAMADEIAENLGAEDAEEEADADALRAAVAEALEENFNESADATDAIALVADEDAAAADEDDDNDNDEDEDSFFGFGGMPLSYIDAIADADAYNDLLEQERNGLIRIVTRYRRSFQSRLIQSQGNVQDYYNILKNALLAYKGIKNRVSWNYESFNRGRVHVAKMNAKTKTLYLYLALDPEQLKDTKYGIVDVSSKKKYASVPVLMKIKGERKFKYALELIDKLCQEELALIKQELVETDYHLPYQTTEELVGAGLVKKMVAGVPVAYFEQPTEEPTEVVNDVTEVAPSNGASDDVTFIAPSDDAAVEAAAEEIAAEAASEGESKEI